MHLKVIICNMYMVLSAKEQKVRLYTVKKDLSRVHLIFMKLVSSFLICHKKKQEKIEASKQQE